MAGEEKKNYLNYLLVGLLIVATFVIGNLYTRVKMLEKGEVGNKTAGNVTPAVTKKSFDEALQGYATEVGIDANKFSACLASGSKKANVEADANLGKKVGVSGTPAFFINGRFLGGAFPLEAFKEIIDKELAGAGSNNYKNYSDMLQKAYEDSRSKSFDPVPKTVAIGDAPVKGQQNAKVTIIEFSDFQCPFCAKVEATLAQVLLDYQGKVQLAYKHFPLPASLHPRAQKAAEASDCAKDQGKFWEFHGKLFENQSEWSSL